MGVDARMFVRISGRDRWLDADAVKKLAYSLAVTVGREHFHIAVAHRALEIVGPYRDESNEEPHLLGKTVWEQDGPPIIAEPDEQFIAVNLRTRFYEDGYPRGDWQAIRTVAEWLERHIPGEVWYGGDSNGVVAQPLHKERRNRINEYYLTLNDQPGDDERMRRDTKMAELGFHRVSGPICKICDVPMAYFASDGKPPDVQHFECAACGLHAVVDASTMAINWCAENRAVSRESELPTFRSVSKHRGSAWLNRILRRH